jgi:predicted helicase
MSGVGVTKDFSSLVTEIIPDLEIVGKSNIFPTYSTKKTTHIKKAYSIRMKHKNIIHNK